MAQTGEQEGRKLRHTYAHSKIGSAPYHTHYDKGQVRFGVVFVHKIRGTSGCLRQDRLRVNVTE